jgi:4-hydroxybenzoate polyprenyltransferase
MIQLIGLLLCVYVFVRALDIWSRIEDRKSRASTMLGSAAVVIALLAALLFAFLFIVQGNSIPSAPSPSF